jgi:DNA-binding transcriptional ArsR family regulator
MPAPRGAFVEVRAGAAFELLIGLFALVDPRRAGESETWVPAPRDRPARLRDALERLGDRAGETWLHLLGLALELPSASAQAFVEQVEEVEPLEFRRHLVGVHVPAWRTVVGAETLERAAAGDASAARELLRSDRYYAGRARDALAVALPLSARETKRRFVRALRLFADVFAPHEDALVMRLERDAQRRRAAVAKTRPEAVIASATGGYVYEPEPEFRRVVLVPHVAATPSLLLCQHLDARLICYPAEDESTAGREVVARAVRLGKALGDPARVQIIRRLAAGEASLGELAEESRVAKSTAHHHLALLRAAGLVTARGNARGYWYALRHEGLGDARDLFGELIAAP